MTSLAEFAIARQKWIEKHCHTDGELQRCTSCNTPIEIIDAFISVHDARFRDICAGGGQVVKVIVPFCPSCESRPSEFGCIHEMPFRGNNPALS